LSFEEKQKQMLALLRERAIYETPAELRTRCAKIKEVLLKYRQSHKKIAVVAHYYIVRTLLAEKFDENGVTIEPAVIRNAEPYFESVERIAQFK
jgi:hypothetical protein